VAFFESKLRERGEVAEYVRTRGVKDETAITWRVGYAPAEWEALSKHLVAKVFLKTI